MGREGASSREPEVGLGQRVAGSLAGAARLLGDLVKAHTGGTATWGGGQERDYGEGSATRELRVTGRPCASVSSSIKRAPVLTGLF